MGKILSLSQGAASADLLDRTMRTSLRNANALRYRKVASPPFPKKQSAVAILQTEGSTVMIRAQTRVSRSLMHTRQPRCEPVSRHMCHDQTCSVVPNNPFPRVGGSCIPMW